MRVISSHRRFVLAPTCLCILVATRWAAASIPLGEQADYGPNNQTKAAWRERALRFIKPRLAHMGKIRETNWLVMPSHTPEHSELPLLFELGINPRRIYAIEGGADDTRKKFMHALKVRLPKHDSRYGEVNAITERLETWLPRDLNVPLSGAILDFTGPVNVGTVLSVLPELYLAPRALVLTNFLAAREQKSTQQVLSLFDGVRNYIIASGRADSGENVPEVRWPTHEDVQRNLDRIADGDDSLAEMRDRAIDFAVLMRTGTYRVEHLAHIGPLLDAASERLVDVAWRDAQWPSARLALTDLARQHVPQIVSDVDMILSDGRSERLSGVFREILDEALGDYLCRSVRHLMGIEKWTYRSQASAKRSPFRSVFLDVQAVSAIEQGLGFQLLSKLAIERAAAEKLQEKLPRLVRFKDRPRVRRSGRRARGQKRSKRRDQQEEAGSDRRDGRLSQSIAHAIENVFDGSGSVSRVARAGAIFGTETADWADGMGDHDYVAIRARGRIQRTLSMRARDLFDDILAHAAFGKTTRPNIRSLVNGSPQEILVDEL